MKGIHITYTVANIILTTSYYALIVLQHAFHFQCCKQPRLKPIQKENWCDIEQTVVTIKLSRNALKAFVHSDYFYGFASVLMPSLRGFP